MAQVMPVLCSHCAYRSIHEPGPGYRRLKILSEGKLCHVMLSLPIFNASVRRHEGHRSLYTGSRGLTATLTSISCIHICLAGNIVIVIVVVVVVVVIFARPLPACMMCASCVRSHDANERLVLRVLMQRLQSFECRVCLASASWARVME